MNHVSNDWPDQAYWLALNRAPGVGPIIFNRLISQLHTPREVFGHFRQSRGDSLLRLPAKTLAYLRAPDWAKVEQDLVWAEKENCQILTQQDPGYPALLLEIPDPPPVLYIKGKVEFLSYPQLAMVGSRNPTASGQRTAYEFSAELAGAGLVITSGLAAGIDTASHLGAVDNNCPTIAVTGCGLNNIYPRENKELANNIHHYGALVSEFSPDAVPLAENFPRRNRIISGLSLGTLVVEAALRSGSLITARFAVEQGREVFAIPGSIHNPQSKGCHSLLRQGAKLVESADDILEELSPLAQVAGEKGARCLDAQGAGDALAEDESRILDYMGYDAVSIDSLVESSGFTPDRVSSILMALEIRGFVSGGFGGRYERMRGKL